MANINYRRYLKILGLLFGGLIGFFILLLFFRQKPEQVSSTVKIRDAVFMVELATTTAQKARGLGYRAFLPKDHGMMFIFDRKEKYGFWMKEMEFPIDIIWIRDDTVVDITADVPVAHGTPLPVYHPKIPVNKVLEINAGRAKKAGIKIGDKVAIGI